MIVKSKARIKYNGERYNIGDVFEIDKIHFESIKDIVESVDDYLADGKGYIEVKDPTDTSPIENYTKAQIVEILSEKGIKFNPRDKKEDLLKLLVEGD